MEIILGINIGHDSGAALISNRVVVACINEERLSRIKMHHGFPFKSIEEILKIAKIDFPDLNCITIEGKHIAPVDHVSFEKRGDLRKFMASVFHLEKFLLGTKLGIFLSRIFLLPTTIRKNKFIESYFISKGFKGKFHYFDHHYCHATTAYYTQQEKDGIAITLDASGEGLCSRVYICHDNKMKLVHSIPCYYSPAYYYAFVTKLLGFMPLKHEGKITGLAAFGDSKNTIKIFEKLIRFDKNKLTFVKNGGYHTSLYKKLERELIGYSKEDIAAGIQCHCENLVEQYISSIIKCFSKFASPNIFLSGGLFANVKINQRISENPNIKSVYIFPNMGDAGLGLGSALAHVRQRIRFDDLYLGKNHDDINIELLANKYNLKIKKSLQIEKDIAKLLSYGKIIARYSGKMEYGPRALGNRSILYGAGDKSVNNWLNKRLNRTEFMPFAPVVRDIDATKYFEIKKENISWYRYMTLSCLTTKHCQTVAQAITHVDNTARPQIITRELNPSYYDVLTHYANITNEGILVNTSFNLHEEPIIDTPEQAIKSFISAKLDVLVINDYLIQEL